MIFKLKQKNNIKNGSSFVVDRIEGKYAVLQNLETKKIINIELDFPIHDGDVIVYRSNQFLKDEEEYKKRKNEILEKFNKVKRRDGTCI